MGKRASMMKSAGLIISARVMSSVSIGHGPLPNDCLRKRNQKRVTPPGSDHDRRLLIPGTVFVRKAHVKAGIPDRAPFPAHAYVGRKRRCRSDRLSDVWARNCPAEEHRL